MEIKTFLKALIIYSLLLIALSSCSLQKRLYNKGFYISKHHAPKKTEQKADKDTSTTLLNALKSADIKEQNKNSTVVAVNDNKPNAAFLLPNTKLIADCDTLMLRNGTKILVKVSEVNPNQIKFRFCNAPDEPLRVLNKKDINYIIYANGSKEMIEQKPNEIHSYSLQPEKLKSNSYSIAGLVLSIVNFPLALIFFVVAALSSTALVIVPIVLTLLAIALCIIGIVQIYNDMSRQDGIALSVGLVLSVILLFALILITASLLA